MGRFGKIIIVLKYFCKKLHLKSLRGSEYASGCNYRRVLNIPGFRVCQVSAYASLAQGSEYA